MVFAVSREGTVLVTLHGGSETTARDEATDEFAATLESLAAEGRISDWEIVDADVYEHPTAPFDPYTIAIEFGVTVVVEADDAAEAERLGADRIDAVLEDADVESVSYAAPPTASRV